MKILESLENDASLDVRKRGEDNVYAHNGGCILENSRDSDNTARYIVTMNDMTFLCRIYEQNTRKFLV